MASKLACLVFMCVTVIYIARKLNYNFNDLWCRALYIACCEVGGYRSPSHIESLA